jgi:hypothetical protein
MNKWMKHGMRGLIITTAAMASANQEPKDTSPTPSGSSFVSVDAMEEMGGSKLKDRMIASTEDDIQMVYALINA